MARRLPKRPPAARPWSLCRRAECPLRASRGPWPERQDCLREWPTQTPARTLTFACPATLTAPSAVLQGRAHRLDLRPSSFGPLDAPATRQQMLLRGREFGLVLTAPSAWRSRLSSEMCSADSGPLPRACRRLSAVRMASTNSKVPPPREMHSVHASTCSSNGASSASSVIVPRMSRSKSRSEMWQSSVIDHAHSRRGFGFGLVAHRAKAGFCSIAEGRPGGLLSPSYVRLGCSGFRIAYAKYRSSLVDSLNENRTIDAQDRHTTSCCRLVNYYFRMKLV